MDLIKSVIILVINKSTPAARSSDFVNHSYDYRPNWTPLSPITINVNNHKGRQRDRVVRAPDVKGSSSALTT